MMITTSRVDGLQVNITVATITNMAGQALQGQLLATAGQPSSIQMQMTPDHEVNVNTWDELGSLSMDKKAWPRHPRRAREMYQSVSQREAQGPERLEALNQGYVLVDPHFTPLSSAAAGGSSGQEEL